MDKLSGLVLDMNDDPNGEVLRTIYPKYEDVPEAIKTSMPLSSTDRAKLPDDVFALVLQDGDVTLRKYACVDEGNTRLHVEYFVKTAHKLPKSAQKIAASNLVTACGWYDIEPPKQLQEIAGAQR